MISMCTIPFDCVEANGYRGRKLRGVRAGRASNTLLFLAPAEACELCESLLIGMYLIEQAGGIDRGLIMSS